MRINWNTKYTTIAVYSFLVICSVILFYLGLSQLSTLLEKVGFVFSVLQPITIGFVIAYLFNFILKFFENCILKDEYLQKVNIKRKRGLGIILTYLTVSIIVFLSIKFVIPQLVESVIGLVNDVPSYINNLGTIFNDLIKDLNLNEGFEQIATENWNQFVNYVIKVATNLLPVLGGVITSIASSVWNIILGLIVSVYLLIDKERFTALSKKVTYGLFPTKMANKFIELGKRCDSTFGKFIIGKILDSTIIGILTFIILVICNMPYTLLVSVIVGVTNIIPFFGPFIGAVPSVIIILFVSPVKAIWFLVIILIIQQIDGNLIGPKILGNTIGISAFWILFSILVTGKLLGIVGMIIGVPLFAVIYTILKEIIENKLRKKGFKTKTKDYM